METIGRMPVCRILTEQQRKWLDSGCCPNCGLPKKEWKRRTDWTCCSKECTNKYSEECLFVWQYWKLKVFERDKYTCVKCGFRSRKEQIIHPDSKKYYEKNLFKVISQDKETLKVLLGDESQLIADHIIPIAIGGEEYELDNVQTLCIQCNKIKTKNDLKEIALYRRKHPQQKDLSNLSDFIQTKSSNEDFPNGEHNINLKESSQEDSQISSNDETGREFQ